MAYATSSSFSEFSRALIVILLLGLIGCERSSEVTVTSPAAGSRTTVPAPSSSIEAQATAVVQSIGELHVIGVYEGAASAGVDASPWWSKCPGGRPDPECHKKFASQHVQKIVKVNVNQTGRPIILALTAYENTLWKIEAADGVVFEKVILAGYHSQDIAGLDVKIPLEVDTYDPSPCVSCKQGQGYFYSYKESPPRLNEITGKYPTSFQGKYRGEEFSISPAASH